MKKYIILGLILLPVATVAKSGSGTKIYYNQVSPVPSITPVASISPTPVPSIAPSDINDQESLKSIL